MPIDDVDVEDVKEDEVAFVAKFRIPLFQKRMRISESIRLEFIAKGASSCFSVCVTATGDEDADDDLERGRGEHQSI